MLIADGFQVPEIPLGEVVAKAFTDVPLQIVIAVTKFGVVKLVTVTVVAAETAEPQPEFETETV